MSSYDTSPIIIEDALPPSYGGERLTGRYGMVSLVGSSLCSEAGIRDAIAKLTAWLDAPRLAARETAEVVAQDGKYGCGYELLRSSAGEWGVLWRDGDGSLPSVHWHTDERQAREEYATERDMALCICGAECDADEIDRSGEEPQCPKCVAAAVEAFKATKFTCVPLDGPGYPGGCGWVGTGADITDTSDGEPFMCPACDHLTVEEIRQ